MGVWWVGNGREETKAIFPREVYNNSQGPGDQDAVHIRDGPQGKATGLSIGLWKLIKCLGKKEWEERKVKSWSKELVPKHWWSDLRQPIPVRIPGNGPEAHIISAKTEHIRKKRLPLAWQSYVHLCSRISKQRMSGSCVLVDHKCQKSRGEQGVRGMPWKWPHLMLWSLVLWDPSYQRHQRRSCPFSSSQPP